MKVTVKRQPGRPIDGRGRRRLEAMRRAQDAALGLFEAKGYAAVTIEQIAQAAGVSAPTLYRGFGTKEQIVLWDEYDPMLLEAIAQRLGARPLRQGVLEALVACLGSVYASDRARILRRSRLMLKQPALLAAASLGQAALRRALADLFLRRRAVRPAFKAEVAAGAIVATLECAVRQWVHEHGRRPLGRVLREAFRHLDALGAP